MENNNKHTKSMKLLLQMWSNKRPVIAEYSDGTEEIFESIQEAARKNHHGKKSAGNVWRVLNGERKTHHGIKYRYDGDGTPYSKEL